MILDDRLPFIQWHDFLLMLDGQLVHFPAPKSHNAREIVFKIDIKLVMDLPSFSRGFDIERSDGHSSLTLPISVAGQ